MKSFSSGVWGYVLYTYCVVSKDCVGKCKAPDERAETTAGICSGHVWSDPRKKKRGAKKKSPGRRMEKLQCRPSTYAFPLWWTRDGRTLVFWTWIWFLSFLFRVRVFIFCSFSFQLEAAASTHTLTWSAYIWRWVGGFFLIANNFSPYTSIARTRNVVDGGPFLECNDINSLISFTCKRLTGVVVVQRGGGRIRHEGTQ